MKKKDHNTLIVPATQKIVTKETVKKQKIAKLILSEGIEKIGNGTFSNQNLTQLQTPTTLEQIGAYAFYNNSQLVELMLNEGLKWIGPSSFEDCNLKEVTIPRSVEHIGKRSFYGNPLEKVILDVYSPFSLGYEEDLYEIFGNEIKIIRKDLHQIKVKKRIY